MSTGVVYFSAYGNTEYIARRLADRLGGELIRIEQQDAARGFFGFLRGGFRASSGRPAPIVGEPWKTAAEHGTLYLLTPIWAGRISPAMRAFLQQAELADREVYPVTLQADPNGHGSDKVHEFMRSQIEGKGGNVVVSYALHTAPPGKFAGEQQLEEELAKIR